jgi:hypothetical protein
VERKEANGIQNNANHVGMFIFSGLQKFLKVSIQAKIDFLNWSCLLILLKYMENQVQSGQIQLRKSIFTCNKKPGQSDDKRIPIQSPNSSQKKNEHVCYCKIKFQIIVEYGVEMFEKRKCLEGVENSIMSDTLSLKIFT